MNTHSVLDTYHQIAFQKGCIQNFHYHQQHSVLVKIISKCQFINFQVNFHLLLDKFYLWSVLKSPVKKQNEAK